MPDVVPSDRGPWKPTACILCSQNCGIEVQTEGRRITRVRGDRAHPVSRGYACEKAQRLDHYQNGRDRVTTPLRRRPDGSFEAIDWDTAIREVADRFRAIRDAHGGESILYYGGGGQGNHLGGGYARATRAALGVVHSSNALAQEKTGEFWVDGQLFGRENCHTCPDFEHAEVAIFVGKNPWQSHGFPRARPALRAIAKDPERLLVVVDPRRTETAELADVHLQVRPGTDAFLLAALLGVLVQENLIAHDFLAAHATDAEPVLAALRAVPVDDWCARAGVDAGVVGDLARRIARARSVSILEDLGIQQAPHSTLASYLEKLAYLLTGNFAKPGAMNLHSAFVSLVGSSGRGRTSPVGGHRIIGGMLPCNVIPDEILTDHPKRFRALLVESANPAHSLADSARMREAFQALELMVVIDVALTETARLAHYVLPAATQFEKWEATFFNLEFPENFFHLRAPLFDPTPGTLPEPEIHRRLVRALGAYDDADVAPLREAAPQGREAFGAAFFQLGAEKPHLQPLAPVILHETLGPTLPDGAASAAALWGVSHLCAMAQRASIARAGFDGDGLEPGEKLFDAVLANRSGFVFSVDPYDATWTRVATPDGRVRLAVPELLAELRGMADEDPTRADPAFPFVLSAGERRTSTANTIFRDPTWRAKDVDGALRMHPDDAARLGVGDGGRVRIRTRRGAADAVVALTDTLQPGHVTLPNGFGLSPIDGRPHGVAPNELTASDDRDPIAGTPWHKHVRAAVEALP
jgi:anaerobic selenocysteine-containing dehydrogenase